MKILSTISATTIGGRDGNGTTSDGTAQGRVLTAKGGGRPTPEHCSRSAIPPASAARSQAVAGLKKDATSARFQRHGQGRSQPRPTTTIIPRSRTAGRSSPAWNKARPRNWSRPPHQICPYSKAIRGNVPVKLTVSSKTHDRGTLPLAGGDHQSPRIHRGPAHARPAGGRAQRRVRASCCSRSRLPRRSSSRFTTISRSAALGHPADIEKVRQTAIDAAHLEGFARSPQRRHRAPARQLQSRARAQGRLRANLRRAAPLPRHPRRARRHARRTTCSGGSITTAPSPRKAVRNSPTAPSSAARAKWRRIGRRNRPEPTLERGSLKSAALSALRLLVWAKLRGTKDQGIEFADTPTESARAQGKARRRKPSNSRCSTALSSASRSPIAYPQRKSWDYKNSVILSLSKDQTRVD